jgi:hypothetical protein
MLVVNSEMFVVLNARSEEYWCRMVLATFPIVPTFIGTLQTPVNSQEIFRTLSRYKASFNDYDQHGEDGRCVQELPALQGLEPSRSLDEFVVSFKVSFGTMFPDVCGVASPCDLGDSTQSILLEKTLISEELPEDCSNANITLGITWLCTDTRSGHTHVLFNRGGLHGSELDDSDQALPLRCDVLGWMPWGFKINSNSSIKINDKGPNEMYVSLSFFAAQDFQDFQEGLTTTEFLLLIEHLIGL